MQLWLGVSGDAGGAVVSLDLGEAAVIPVSGGGEGVAGEEGPEGVTETGFEDLAGDDGR